MKEEKGQAEVLSGWGLVFISVILVLILIGLVVVIMPKILGIVK